MDRTFRGVKMKLLRKIAKIVVLSILGVVLLFAGLLTWLVVDPPSQEEIDQAAEENAALSAKLEADKAARAAEEAEARIKRRPPRKPKDAKWLITCGSPRTMGLLIGFDLKDEVRARLHDPNSLRDWKVATERISDDCRYIAVGTFTATNGFGGRVRGRLAAEVLAEEIGGKHTNISIRKLAIE